MGCILGELQGDFVCLGGSWLGVWWIACGGVSWGYACASFFVESQSIWYWAHGSGKLRLWIAE